MSLDTADARADLNIEEFYMPMPGAQEILTYFLVAHVLIPFALCSLFAVRRMVVFCFAIMLLVASLVTADRWLGSLDNGLGVLAISEWALIAVVVGTRTMLGESKPAASSMTQLLPFQWSLRELTVLVTGIAAVLAGCMYYANDNVRLLALIGAPFALVAILALNQARTKSSFL